MNLSLWNILLYQNRGAKTKQLDEGIVDTFVLDDVLRSMPARALREIARRKKCYCLSQDPRRNSISAALNWSSDACVSWGRPTCAMGSRQTLAPRTIAFNTKGFPIPSSDFMHGKLTTVTSFHCGTGDFNVVVYSAAPDADSRNHRSVSIFDGIPRPKVIRPPLLCSSP